MADVPIASGSEVHLYYCDADGDVRDSLVPGFQQLLESGAIAALRYRCISGLVQPTLTLENVPVGDAVIKVVLLSPDFFACGGCLESGIEFALDESSNAALITLLVRPLDATDPTVARMIECAIESTALSDVEDPERVVQDFFTAIRNQGTHQSGKALDLTTNVSSATIRLPERKTSKQKNKREESREESRRERMAKRTNEPDPVPERIGRKFKVKRVLGEGAFGRVYLAEDEELRRSVAIKMPHQRRIANADDVEAYIKEAQMVAQLDHPGIVPVHEVGRDAGQVYVVSKLIEGKNLAEMVRESRPSYVETARLVATVADALHHAHQQNLVHRDIKPANILVDQGGRPYVTDFGLAIREEEISERLRMAGTPAYMSPEQARGEGHCIDPRSDVFSLGVVFYELLTGEQPFLRSKPESIREILARISKADVRPPRQRDASIPVELERICLRAMANRRTERYSIAKDLADDLWEFLEDVEAPISVHESGESTGGAWSSHGHHSRSSSSRRGSERASGSRRSSGGARSSGRSQLRTGSSRGSDDGRSTHAFELHSTVQGPNTIAEEIKIIPKGLRAFDQADADFFLALLPGPRDRYQVPESIRFWQRKIENYDAQETFRIGVVYGPSGCGKTSLVHAGLLPLLDECVHLAVLDATAKDTEITLTHHIRQLCPSAPPDADLAETIAWIRRGRGLPPQDKLLIVIDQFEQWLQASSDSDELLNALRQCDGRRVQCLLMVRDDFIMSIHRFMKDVEEPIREGHNAAAVELFDPLHARDVLRSFGASYGRLPEKDEELTEEQNGFLDGAIEELAEDNRIVPVQLALLADMCKGREWKFETLQTFGGTRGVGEAFLQETFETRLQHQFHQGAARAALKSLLPLPGSRIRDKQQSRSELAKSCGYDVESAEFTELISILDGETRLITPIETSSVPSRDESTSKEQSSEQSAGQAYQLTHDYLVPSLREWLTRKQKETARGRAELRLEELSLLWNDKPENRRLPGLVEWTAIRYYTRRIDWSPSERKMMRVATRRTLTKATIVVVLLTGTILGLRSLRQQQMALAVHAEIEKLPTALTSEVPGIVAQLGTTRKLSRSLLRSAYPDHSRRKLGKLNTSIALLEMGTEEGRGAELLDYVYERLRGGTPSEVRGIQESLSNNKELLLERVQKDFTDTTDAALPLASVLAAYTPQEEWHDPMQQIVAKRLVDEPTDSAGGWRENLEPVCARLRSPLRAILFDDQSELKQRLAAGNLLFAYAPTELGERITFLARLIAKSADADQFKRNVELLEAHPVLAIDVLTKELERLDEAASGTRGTEREAIGFQQMYVAAAVMKLGGNDVWDRLKYLEDPTLRSLLVGYMAWLGVDASLPFKRFAIEEDVTIRRALCLALAGYEGTAFSDREVTELSKIFEACKQHPDAGLHAAADYVQRVWVGKGITAQAERSPTAKPVRDERIAIEELDRTSPTWFQSSTGHTFVAVRGPVTFKMGSPDDDPDRERAPGTPGKPEGTTETQHNMTIPRSFAIANEEVTVSEFLKAWSKLWLRHEEFHRESREEELFQGNVLNPASPHTSLASVSPSLECPINGVSWFQAAAYCNLLSEQEGIPRDQWCYDPDQEFTDQMILPADYLRRTGYRLPTEAEWEYVCRAGSTTSRFYGEGTSLLSSFAWYLPNSGRVSHPVGILKPNDFGFFDLLGNIEEWCQDQVRTYARAAAIDEEAEGDELTVNKQFNRSHRGGGYEYVTHRVRSATRDRSDPDYAYYMLGFRVARTLPD